MEHNGNPFSPQNLGSIPTGTVIEIQVVRANQQSKDGAPRIDAPNRLGASHPYKKTGAIEIEATYPFIIGTSRSLDCANSGSHRTVDADARVYPVSRPDNELKRSTFYMKACRTVSASELDDAKLELRPIKASRQYRGYEYTNGIRVRHYQNMNAQTATASFHARPDEMTISREDTWYGPITLHTTSGSTSSVRVVANPNDDTPLVEIGSSTITANNCRNGAERNDSRTVRTGGAIKIAMCGAGTGTLELRHPTTGDLINSYIVALSGSTSVVPAPAPVITPTCSTTSLASASGSRSGRWSASDCTSPYRTNKYVDYYRMTAGSSQEMRIDLTSSEDAYLLFYNGTSTTGAPDAFNDDYGGETDARLTVDLVGGRTYTIGATTYSDRTTGSYSLRLTPVTIAVVVPAPGTPNRPSVTAGNARVSLDWSNVANATGYEVQQWDSVARVWRALPSGGATVSFNGSSATVRGLTNGVSYYHRVRATNSAHQSGWSSYSTAKPTVTLTVPSNLEGTGYSSGRIALDWSNVSNAAEYEVQQWDGRAQLWRTLPFTEQGFSSEYRISFSGSSANIYNLSSGVSYSHRVRAMNGLIVTTWTSFITTSVP